MADVATQSEELKNSKFFNISVEDSYHVDLKNATLEEVKYLIEIVFHVSTRDDVLKMFPELLPCVKKYWNDEEIMNGIVKLFLDIMMESSKDPVTTLNSDGVISTVLVLSGLLFSHNPDTMGLFRIIDFPRNTEYSNRSLSHLLIEIVLTSSKSIMSDESADNKSRTKNCSNIIRPIVPIMSLVLKGISEGFVNLIDLPPVRMILHLCLDLIKMLWVDSSEINLKDIELLLTSEITEWLMTIFEKSPQNKCCSTQSEGPSILLQNCDVFRVLVELVELFKTTVEQMIGILSQNEMIKIFMIWSRFLDNRRAFGEAGPQLIKATMLISYIIAPSNFDFPVYRKFLCDPEKSPFPSIIKFVYRKTDCIGFFSLALSTILEEQSDKFKDLFPLIMSLPDTILDYLLTKDFVSPRKRKNLALGQDVNIKRVEPDLVFNSLKDILSRASLTQLQELEIQFGIIDKILRLFRNSKNSSTLLHLVEILSDLVEKQHDKFSLLSAETLLELMIMVWDRVKISSHSRGDPHPVTTLTYNVSLYVPGSCHIDYTKFLPGLLVDLDNINRFKPPPPGMLKLIWLLVKQPEYYKQPYKKLAKLSCDKPVEYASPGKRELAQIFRLISDLIIENLEQDPPLSGKYLLGLAKCIVSIAQSCTLDEELYILEDLVSPAIWLLEKQSEKEIVANVKEFISILH